MRRVLVVVSILIIVAGIVVSYIFFRKIGAVYTYNGIGKILMDETGQVGDFIGGVIGTLFSFAGTILLLVTLYNQIDAHYIENFEGKFFKLLELYRSNVDELRIPGWKLVNGGLKSEEIERRQVFKTLVDHFGQCFREIKPFFEGTLTSQIYEPTYLAGIRSSFSDSRGEINLNVLAQINIAYCVIFFGVGDDGLQILKKLFSGKYMSSFAEPILLFLRMKPVVDSRHWDKWEKIRDTDTLATRMGLINRIIEQRRGASMEDFTSDLAFDMYYDDKYVKYYGGNQHRLGHYYRHLFQTVKFVNQQSNLRFKEKYFYVKTLRGQLSTHEHVLLFLNSLSFLGMAWELAPEYKRSKFDFMNRKRLRDNELITRYNLIKKVSGESIFDMRYKDFYPLVDFELDTIGAPLK